MRKSFGDMSSEADRDSTDSEEEEELDNDEDDHEERDNSTPNQSNLEGNSSGNDRAPEPRTLGRQGGTLLMN